jgi:hypothetical protein
MAPTTRSGKGLNVEEVNAHKKALHTGPVHVTGLPGLPTEMLTEIVSHFPIAPIPSFSESPEDSSYLERRKVIGALSQMCSKLRSVFLPLYWERIEVVSVPNPKETPSNNYSRVMQAKHQAKALATEIVWQLEIATVRDNTLAPYVRPVFTSATLLVYFINN